jgi:prevent-host-death family protein
MADGGFMTTRSTDITNLTEHRQNLRAHLNRVKRTGRPLYITTNGKPEAVVLSAKAYDHLAELAEVEATVAMMRVSRADIAAGRVQSVDGAFSTIRKRLGLRK